MMRVLVFSLFVGMALAAPQGYNYQSNYAANTGGALTYPQIQLLQQFASQQEQSVVQQQTVTITEPQAPVQAQNIAPAGGSHFGNQLIQLASYGQQQQQVQQPQQLQGVPQGFSQSIQQQIPAVEQQLQPQALPVPQPLAQPQVQPQLQSLQPAPQLPQAQPEPQLQLQQPQPQFVPLPQAQPQPQPQPQFLAQPQQQPQAQPQPQFLPQPQAQPQFVPQLQAQPQPQYQPQPQFVPQPQPQPQFLPQPQALPQSQAEPQQQQSVQYSSAPQPLPQTAQHHAPAITRAPESAYYNKEYYYLSAPQENYVLPPDFNDQLNKFKKNLRVVFIKSPEQKGLENATLQLVKDNQQPKTAIYVLTKQHSAAELAKKLQQQPASAQQKPEVIFIKYRTPQEAEHAQHTIQSQYESLNGPNHFNFEGGVATHNFIGSTAAIEPRIRPVEESAGVANAATQSPLDYLPPAE
ncbi:uncharacterized protein LOC105211958 [Zeugodacus cucurbitae]|uniref:uncharacterized protein LOC105211958 n=1 Tax=Zeugodacus cucurbitae TaxID=28588 RepID=UPI0023D93EC7|nr:uncharacterized protein LOC105211958 [Zeugodacus cucurbitae]